MNKESHKDIYEDLIFKIKMNINQNTRVVYKNKQLWVYLFNKPLGYLKNV